MFAFNERKKEWQEFLFERIEGMWRPRVNHLNKNSATNCIRCHGVEDANGKIVLTPRAKQLRTKADLYASGYTDDRVIEAMMKAFPFGSD